MYTMHVFITFTAKLWLYNGQAAWHFITIPKDISAQLREQCAPYARGFQSLKVRVKIHEIEWDTSIFFDTKQAAYLLPIKKEIRTKTHIKVDDLCNVFLTIIM
jgi:Domain of unknown function (DUF1905)